MLRKSLYGFILTVSVLASPNVIDESFKKSTLFPASTMIVLPNTLDTNPTAAGLRSCVTVSSSLTILTIFTSVVLTVISLLWCLVAVGMLMLI